MNAASARVLLVSHRFIKPHVSWANVFELEDVICEVDDVDLLAPKLVEPKALPGEAAVITQLRRRLGIEVQRRPQIEKTSLTRSYDLLFLSVMTLADLRILDSVEHWKQRCGLKVCWVEELWVDNLRHTKLLGLLDQFDYVFVGHVASPEPLSRIIEPPCGYLSFGVDALRFCPYPNPPARSIDFYALGRRSPEVHQALYDRAGRGPNFHYFYDSARWTHFVEDHVQHRELTANLIKRSRYFMADRAKADVPDQTKGSQVFGPRYFEGAGAGAILIGEPPDCDVFRSYFDWPDAVIPFAYGSSGIIELIESLDADPERIARARRANVTGILRRHDWSERWKETLAVLGLQPRPGMLARTTELQRRAREVEAATFHGVRALDAL